MTEQNVVDVLIEHQRTIYPPDVVSAYDELMRDVKTCHDLRRAWAGIAHGALCGAVVDVSRVTCSEKDKADLCDIAEYFARRAA